MDDNNLNGQQPTQPLQPIPPSPPTPAQAPVVPSQSPVPPAQPAVPAQAPEEPTMLTTDALDQQAAEAPRSTISEEEPNINSEKLSPIESLIVGEDALRPESGAVAPVVPPLTVVSDSASLGDSQPDLNSTPAPAAPTQPSVSPSQPSPITTAQPVTATTAPQPSATQTSQLPLNPAQPTSPIMNPSTPIKKAPVGLIIGIVAGVSALVVAIILIFVLTSKHMLTLGEFDTKIKTAKIDGLSCNSNSDSDQGGYTRCYSYTGDDYITINYVYAKDKEVFETALKENSASEYVDKAFEQECDEDGDCETIIRVENSLLRISANRENTDKIRKALGY